MTRAVECDMRIRWPWQTREDLVIAALDEAIRVAAKERAEAADLTKRARDEAIRKLEGER